MKNLVINVLAKTGSSMCRMAIKLAGHGDIKFEIYTKPMMPELTFYKFPIKLKTIWNGILVVIAVMALLVATHIAASAINESADKLVQELKHEHHETMQILHWGNR